MLQLWLDGKRIDSIRVLRDVFVSCEDEAREALAYELLRKTSDGIFIPWLNRCHETFKKVEGNVLSASRSLIEPRVIIEEKFTQGEISDEVASSFAKLCGVEKEVFISASSMNTSRTSQSSLHRKELELQPWYQNDPQMQRAVDGIPKGSAAVDSDSLAKLLATRRPKSRGTSTVDIYLLNIGKVFMIRSLTGLSHVRLVGYGNPAVRFSPYLRKEKLDMLERNIKFERLNLHRQGVSLIGEKERCVEVEFD
jgi:hypothetical protein